MLQIDPRKVCYLIFKAREFDAKVAVVEPDPGSNPSDEGMRGVLEDYPDDPVDAEIRTLVDSLNEDEQIDLVTLLWLGRADSSPRTRSIRRTTCSARRFSVTTWRKASTVLATIAATSRKNISKRIAPPASLSHAARLALAARM